MAQFAQRVFEPCCLVYAGREHHARTAITDHLGFETKLPYDVLNGCALRCVRRHQHLPNLKRRDAACLQRLHQQFGRWVGKSRFFPACGIVEDRPILGDDEVEQWRARTDYEQIVEPAAREQDCAPAGDAQTLEDAYRLFRHFVIRGQRAVIVRHECEVTLIIHPPWSPTASRISCVANSGQPSYASAGGRSRRTWRHGKTWYKVILG